MEKGISSIGARKKLVVVSQDCIALDLGTYMTLILYSRRSKKQESRFQKMRRRAYEVFVFAHGDSTLPG